MSSPAAVAAAAAAAPRPLLVAVDVDGTLSPIVAHPGDAVLLPGAREALTRVGAAADVTVVVVSGRPLQELRDQFGFDSSTRLIGSHGLQDSAVTTAALSPEEPARLDAVRAELSTLAAGVPGAWVEDKPLTAVLHVARAEPVVGDALLAEADARLRDRPGLWLIPGRRVLEATVRPASKRPAVERLRAETGAAAVVYLGDDVTDEAVLEALRPPDVGVRVGELPSVAPYRLAGPAEVVTMLDELAADLVSR
ncbi:MAG TPA: trehalose-phosphatase [Acidimicrobiales bacterium]|nr:trehalose-phosphatase [Acidimicrobiales bacterium]